MVLRTVSNVLGKVDTASIGAAVMAGVTLYFLKVYAGGRKCIWEREWAGKLIIIAAPPTPTTLALIHHLLHLPSPPQVLYLPPAASPLPQDILTIMHTIRLGITSKQAQLHCEPLPCNPAGVRDFVRKWSSVPYGTAGEGGRRVDAIVLGGGWECESSSVTLEKERDAILSGTPTGQPDWTPAQYHFHFVHSILPALLKAPAERNIRVIELVSPAWSAALPGIKAGLEGKAHKHESGALAAAARRGVTTLLVQDHFRLILDTLASAAFSKKTPVPDPEAEEKPKKRDDDIQSNIMALSVIMPWARDEVLKPVWGSGNFLQALLWILLYPLVLIITPSPSKSIQSILFALSAPVKYAGEVQEQEPVPQPPPVLEAEANGVPADPPKKKKDDDEVTDPRRNGISQGDVVRNCATIDLPPVLHDPLLARATYEKLQDEVEAGVKAYEARLKTMAEAAEKAREEKGTKVKFSEPQPAS